MSKSYEPQIKWRANEVEELIASMKERELLKKSNGKKRRSLRVFSGIRGDLQRKGIFRTDAQIRKKMSELRKLYFEANRSELENCYELCVHYDALHDLFTDTQRKLDKRTELSRTRGQRHHSQNGVDVSNSVQSNVSKSNSRSASADALASKGHSSICSNAHSSKHNHTSPQPQQQQENNGGETIHNGGRRKHSTKRMVPDKLHLKQSAYPLNLINSLTNLCKNDRYADVMLLVCNDDDSIAIPAHRLVLGTFSPYFANVFKKLTLALSTPTIYVALPSMITRAAMKCLLEYMYTGEAFVLPEILDEVMMCGEFLRIKGFSAKMASSMLRSHKGLVSLPHVTVTKTINMDSSLQSDARLDGSTPVPATVTTRASPATPIPIPIPASMTVRPDDDDDCDSQSPPRKIARHNEPMQQQTLFQQPEMQQLQQPMYEDELLEPQLMQQAQPPQMLPQRQFAHQRQLQQYQSQQMSDDLFQPMSTLRQQQNLMMQLQLQLQSTMQQQLYHLQQRQTLNMDLLQLPLQTMPMQRQRQQHSLSQSQSQLQQSVPLVQQSQRQMVQMPQSSLQQQRQRMPPQQLQNDYQSEEQLQDDLQDPEQLVESQEMLEPQQPRQRQPTTQIQQSQQPVQQRLLQQGASQPPSRKPQLNHLQADQLPENQELLEPQELIEPQQPQRTLCQQPQMQNDLMEPQELLESQELLAPQKPRQILQQRQPLQLQRMLAQRVTQQQKRQEEVIKPQELLETEELLEPQKPRPSQPERAPQQSEQTVVKLTPDESMMEIITKSPESQTSHFSTRSHSPDSQAKINALIEHVGMSSDEPDESMMEIITTLPESQTSHFSMRSHSPDSQAKINALIENIDMPDTDITYFHLTPDR